MLVHVSDGTSMEQLLGKAHRYMKAEGKQGRRKYLRYGKAARVSTPLPRLLQALLPEAPSWVLQRERHALGGAVAGVGKDSIAHGVLGGLVRLAALLDDGRVADGESA